MTAFHWSWPALLLLGAYHGLNPGMGWLFAVALGMQEKRVSAVLRSLGPIALGHMLSIGAVVLLAGLIEIVLPLRLVTAATGGGLVILGLYRLLRNRHFRWGSMQVGYGELTLWSFLMASAHGAGLMVLPIILSQVSPAMPVEHQMHMAGLPPSLGVWAMLVHTLGYLVVTAALALVVYLKLGLSLLRTAWFNLDRVWAFALIVTGCLAFILLRPAGV